MDIALNKCISCSSFMDNCIECSIITGSTTKTCTKCELGTYLLNGTCVSKCPSGYENYVIADNKCYVCSSSCDKCSGALDT